MKTTNKIFVGACLIICMFPFVVVNAQEGTSEIARDEVMWSCGYWAAPNHWNPGFWGGFAWGTMFMYLPMFDYNFQTNTLIPMIGETIEWNADGSELHVKIHDEASWSDGTPITSQDVNWTFAYFYDMGQWSGAFSERVDNFNIVNDKEFICEMNEDYYFSKDIYFRFVGFEKVLPQHVWDAITIEYSGSPLDSGTLWDIGYWSFTNNWLEEDFPDDWKVASGPYHPYFLADTLDKEVYSKVDDWWGADVITDNYDDMPKYIGHLIYATNFAMNAAFADNQIDWYGSYYPRIWELLEENENIHTWVEEDPYFLPTSGMVELVPNHRRYPFNQHWFREALAYAINYDDLSEVSASGYLEKARVGWIDDRSPVQDDFYDPEVEAEYAYDFDIDKSIEILEEYCFQVEGVWYTKNSDAYLGDLGTKGLPVADDLETIADDESTDVDEAALSANVNVMINDYDIIVPYGWSDSMMQTVLLSNYFKDIGITTNPTFLEYGTYESTAVSGGGSDWDLMNFVMGFSPGNNVFNGLQKFTGEANNWANYSAWHSPEYYDKLIELETAEPGSTAEIDIAHDMQEILAQTLPSIPIAPNGYWYGYCDKYWQGFPNEKDPYIQETAPWEEGHTGAMLTVIMNLKPAGRTEGAVPGYGFGIIFGCFAVITVVIYRKKTQK